MNTNFLRDIEPGFVPRLDERCDIRRFGEAGVGHPLGQIDGIPNPDTAG